MHLTTDPCTCSCSVDGDRAVHPTSSSALVSLCVPAVQDDLLHGLLVGMQILDIPKTLEYLETQGVTVVAHRSNDFPAFFVPSSGLRAPWRIDCPTQCAHGLKQCYCVPVPQICCEAAARAWLCVGPRAMRAGKDVAYWLCVSLVDRGGGGAYRTHTQTDNH